LAETPSEKPTVDGRELEFLDGLLPNIYPLARQGDQSSVDRVLKILELRLKYRRQRIAEED
jgi:hypothetical protein